MQALSFTERSRLLIRDFSVRETLHCVILKMWNREIKRKQGFLQYSKIWENSPGGSYYCFVSLEFYWDAEYWIASQQNLYRDISNLWATLNILYFEGNRVSRYYIQYFELLQNIIMSSGRFKYSATIIIRVLC